MTNRTVLIAGMSNTGKSTSLRNLKDRAGYAYLNCDDKALPIGGAKAFLTNQRVTNPHDIVQYYTQLENTDQCKGIILDTLTHLMASYERKVVDVSDEGFGAWKDYGNFYKSINDLIKGSNKTNIIMAHTDTQLVGMDMISKILVKGSVGKLGVEADHSIVVTSKQMPIAQLMEFETPLLTYSAQEKATGMKYVFSTMLNKQTVGDRTRAPLDFWKTNEMYIDNDIQIVLDRFDEFYGE